MSVMTAEETKTLLFSLFGDPPADSALGSAVKRLITDLVREAKTPGSEIGASLKAVVMAGKNPGDTIYKTMEPMLASQGVGVFNAMSGFLR